MKLNRIFLLSGCILLYFSNLCYAGDIFAGPSWPFLLLGVGILHSWYLVPITIGMGTIILYLFVESSLKKAFLISVVAKVFSATIGLFLLIGSMMVLFSIIGDDSPLCRVVMLIIMFFLNGLFEAIVVKIIWKYEIKETILCLAAGNLIYYLFIANDFIWKR